mmetsp:Transcript_71243/g.133245  ORF Transcript_71243/g.133245 Transcript_71243/m.133245 type:complete len:447 (-) Transcript_71243:21-1361(-)
MKIQQSMAMKPFLTACVLYIVFAPARAAKGLRGQALEIRHHESMALKVRNNRRHESRLTPLPNDTISANYFATADSLIESVARSTPEPPDYNHLWDEPPVPPYEQVHTMQQPWDTHLGAKIVAEFEPQPTASPLPDQQWVSQTFVSQCPFLQFGDMVYINGPKCGQPGTWTAPSTGRVLARFERLMDGSLAINVDSAVSGNGSVEYAFMAASLEATKASHFHLKNCMGVPRYEIEERITKVQSMGAGSSTMLQHDSSALGTAFFETWLLRHANGSVVGGSPMVRVGQNQVIYTRSLDDEGESLTGGMYANATRHGGWKGSGWRTCDNATRRWEVQFTETTRNFENAGTVMDMRVATLATLTLMALRDENRSAQTGVAEAGDTMLLNMMILRILVASLFLTLIGFIAYRCFKHRVPDRLYAYFDTVERAALPKRPVRPYKPVFPQAW